MENSLFAPKEGNAHIEIQIANQSNVDCLPRVVRIVRLQFAPQRTSVNSEHCRGVMESLIGVVCLKRTQK